MAHPILKKIALASSMGTVLLLSGLGNAFAMMEAVAILAVLLQTVHLENRSATAAEPLMRVTLRPQDRLIALRGQISDLRERLRQAG